MVLCYQIFAWLNIVLSGFTAAVGCLLLFWPEAAKPEDLLDFGSGPDPIMTGVVYAVGSVIFMMLFAATVLLEKSYATWLISLVLIAFYMLNCCCLPILAPMLWFWVKPETQSWYTFKPLPPSVENA